MNYDLALYPASGPGLGHLMRCYAIAEAAVEMGRKVVVVLDKEAPYPVWPCVVLLDEGEDRWPDAEVSITDIPRQGSRKSCRKLGAWRIVDKMPVAKERIGAGGYIYPHFGATPVPGYPTLYGEQWMPLRKQFRGGKATGTETGTYRQPDDIEPGAIKLQGDTASALRRCIRATVPPSTIAYEAMAMGVNVELSYDPDEYTEDMAAILDRIAAAMVAGGAARMWTPDLHRASRTKANPIDGRGAIRILEVLL